MKKNLKDYNINIEFEPCNKHDPYLQWKHIAEWQFQFNLTLMIREEIEQLGEVECRGT